MTNIKWNKVTWYSKLIALIIFVALPFVFFYYGTQYGKTVGYLNAALSASSTQPIVAAASTGAGEGAVGAYYNDPAEWQTDANNTSGGFSIAYPLDFDTQDNFATAPSIDWRVSANGVPGIKYFTLTVPRAFEPQTNLVDVRLTVGASGTNAAIAQCLTQDATGGTVTPTSTATVNGIDFTVFHSAGVGAGNYYDTTSYRTLHAGECYAVEYTVHSGQIMNYPSSYNLHPFDAQKIDSLMQTIIGTFKFD